MACLVKASSNNCVIFKNPVHKAIYGGCLRFLKWEKNVDEDTFPKVKTMAIRVQHKPLGEGNNSIL